VVDGLDDEKQDERDDQEVHHSVDERSVGYYCGAGLFGCG